MSLGSCAIKKLQAKQIVRMMDRFCFILVKFMNKEKVMGSKEDTKRVGLQVLQNGLQSGIHPSN